jgi:uncharacterized Zn finger protein
MNDWYGSYWEPRKSAAQRRAEAAEQVREAARRGTPMSPVVLAGRKIAETFWGKAWCDNLERYQDFAYRLDRGRSYLRSGSVIDLRIAAGKVVAQVSGSELYDVEIQIDAVKADAWRAIQRDCAGGIGSRLDLLAGRLSAPVMTRMCADRTGMFPAPSAIRFTCSCPDHARMCKHVAAVMYGIGARFDHAPELLFTLRKVSADELLASALSTLPAKPAPGRVLASGGLAALFGLELAEPSAPVASPKPAARAAKQIAKAAKPVAQLSKSKRLKPAAKPLKPAAKALKPAAKPSKPAAKPSKPAAKPLKPAAKAPTPTATRRGPTAKPSKTTAAQPARR